MIEHLTLESFNEKIMDIETKEFKNENPIVLKFSALWCVPCKSYTPIFETVSEELENVDFYSVDVDDEIEISNMFSIRSVPTTIIIGKDGKKNSFSGSMQKGKLLELINSI
jgi:thioredoxin